MYRRILLPALLAVASALVLLSPFARAASDGIDEDALARRITEQVIQQLQQGGVLKEQIRLGIEEFVREQRAAQARARNQQGNTARQRAKSVRRVSASRDHIFGNADARISLIEYSDFECPFCKRFHKTAKQAIEAYDGKLNWVYRHFPLPFHNPLAQREAEATECAVETAGNDGFWRFADALFERTRSNGNGFPMDGFVPLAKEFGYDTAAFRECLDSGRFKAHVLEDYQEGQAIGITGTPGNILLDNRTGKVRVVEGAVPLGRLRSEIDALLAGS